jgi:16S rRNA (cytidine1402-2'-O)-methyltransferase
MPGRLYLVPNLLGFVPPQTVLPRRTIAIACGLRHFVVENAKPARQFLKALGTTRRCNNSTLRDWRRALRRSAAPNYSRRSARK